MYYYIFDQGNLPMDKFERLQTEALGYFAEFKISGEAARVTPLRSVADLVDTASQRGAKTLVACGSDDTFNLMLASLKGRDFTLGFVPLDEKSFLSKILGIENIYIGAKTIAARRIEKIDLAKISNNFFINYLEFGVTSHNLKSLSWYAALKLLSSEARNYTIRIDDSYNLSIAALGGLAINIRSASASGQKIADPTDSHLDLLILEKMSKMQILRYRQDIVSGNLEKIPNTTVIKCRKIDFLEPRGTPLTMLGRIVAKFPAAVELIPQRLRLIVGKNRTF